MKNLIVIFALLLFTDLCFAQPPDGKKQKGVCWVGERREVTAKEIAILKKYHVNWISQTPFAFQREPNTSSIRTDFSAGKVWWGESDEGIKKTTELARKAGIHTILKPHIWVGNSWPGEIAMKSDTAWQRWFRLYEKFILHYAGLAQQCGIEIFCVGTELHQTIDKEKEWRGIIGKVRSVYKGKVTYAANFHKEFEQIAFWDALDFIGIQAYFSLTTERHLVSELKQGWVGPMKSIERVHKKFKMPVLFTEIGYRNDTKAGIEPWAWPKENNNAKVSDECQANCYRAFFETAWQQPWMAGAYFWKWYPHGPTKTGQSDFTPQNREAQNVLANGFKD